MTNKYNIEFKKQINFSQTSVSVVDLGGTIENALANINLRRTMQLMSRFQEQERDLLKEMHMNLMQKKLKEVGLFIGEDNDEQEHYAMSIAYMQSGDFGPLEEVNSFVKEALLISSTVPMQYVRPTHRLEIIS